MSNRLYFAYGSNMDQRQMDYRCPAAVMVSTGWLNNYGYRIEGRGFATVIPEENSRVWGVVWKLTEACEVSLDGYEGVSKGIYWKEIVTIESGSSERSCLVYIASYRQALSGRQNLPSLNYQDRIVAAAAEFNFPSEYQSQLAKWLPNPVQFSNDKWVIELEKQRKANSRLIE